MELTKELRLSLDDAFDKITVDMINSLDYGEDLEVNENFTISHHSEEDCITLVLTEDWDEVYSVMTDEDGQITFESTGFFDNEFEEESDYDVLVEKVKELIGAIKNNETDLWIPSLTGTVECVVLNKESFGNGYDDDHKEFEELKFNDIRKQIEELEKLIKK